MRRRKRRGNAPNDGELESAAELQERLLEQIAAGGRLWREAEELLRQNPGPELETIIKLYRVLVLQLSAEAQAEPNRVQLLNALMRPVMEWGRLEEKRKLRELAEQKFREETSAQKAKERTGSDDALTPGTLKKIEREIHLF